MPITQSIRGLTFFFGFFAGFPFFSGGFDDFTGSGINFHFSVHTVVINNVKLPITLLMNIIDSVILRFNSLCLREYEWFKQ